MTSESLHLTVDSDGCIVSFNTNMLHAFDNIADVRYDEDKIVEIISYKIANIYKNVDTYREYTIKNFYFTKLKNGSFGLVYNIDCIFEKVYIGNDGSYTIPTTPITLLITGATTRPAE